MKITKKQIKQLDNQETTVRELFPEVFETKLKDIWYRIPMQTRNQHHTQDAIIKKNNDDCYGVNHLGEWTQNYFLETIKERGVKATEEEVQEALFNEAERRDYKEGLTIKSELGEFKLNDGELSIDEYGDIGFGNFKDIYTLFHNGKWAEIIEEPKDEIISFEDGRKAKITWL